MSILNSKIDISHISLNESRDDHQLSKRKSKSIVYDPLTEDTFSIPNSAKDIEDTSTSIDKVRVMSDKIFNNEDIIDIQEIERIILSSHPVEISFPNSNHSLSATTEECEGMPIKSCNSDSQRRPDTTIPKIPVQNIETSHFQTISQLISSPIKKQNTIKVSSSQLEKQTVRLVTDSDNTVNGTKENNDTLINPVSQKLQFKPSLKNFKLINNNDKDDDSLSIPGTPVLNINSENKMESASLWVLQDYEEFFGTYNFENENNFCKSLRFIDETKKSKLKLGSKLKKVDGNFKNDVIFITNRIINPDKILSWFFDRGDIFKFDIYIDLVMNNNGCSVFLQLIKYFEDNTDNIKKIKSIFVRISASYVHQMKMIVEMFARLTQLYNKIKSLGLFIGLHQYDNGYVFGTLKQEEEGVDSRDLHLKLPNSLEKLILTDDLKLIDFAQLPITIHYIGLHNVEVMNFSKFNLVKKLENLHISGSKIELVGRFDNFPIGFLELRDLKLDSSIVVNFNFKKFLMLSSLSLSDLSFSQSRNLEFITSSKSVLKKIEFINCHLSSHINSFPDSLRVLNVIRGKWMPKRNCNLSNLLRLKVVDVEVTDLTKKIKTCKNLLKLEIDNCELNGERLILPPNLKTLNIKNTTLKQPLNLKNLTKLESLILRNNQVEHVAVMDN